MAFDSADGKRKFSMSSRKRAYDMGHPVKQEATEPPDGEHEGMDGEEDGSAIAEAHGPAHEVHVTHDDESGQHHVHSMHPDGHEHHSDHESRKHAHEHAAKVSGAEEMGTEGDGMGEMPEEEPY